MHHIYDNIKIGRAKLSPLPFIIIPKTEVKKIANNRV